ncbi:SAM-dependent methyltransferase, partial [Mycobacterium talmoniae]
MGESSIVVRPQPPGLRRAIAAFERAAEAVPLPDPPQPIVLADYGAADGRNALLPLGAAIKVIRRRTRHEHAVLVAHTDAPHNDFTDLFSTLADDPDSYLHTDSASFPAAIGRSFYGQILPSKSVTLGWTSWATMWLSRAAAELPEIPDHVQIAYSADDTARAAYARQAAQDWHDFVAFRGRELCPGGRLTVLTMAVGADGEFGYRPLFDAIAAALGDQVRDGLLGAEEARRMTIPIFARSEKDFRAPFAPTDRFEGCSIEQLEIFEADDPFWADYAADNDAAAFGARWAAFTRLSAFPILAAALDGGPADPRADEFAAHLEAGVAARLASKPEPMQ